MEAGTPKGPEGERRPADANARAGMTSKIEMEEIEDVAHGDRGVTGPRSVLHRRARCGMNGAS